MHQPESVELQCEGDQAELLMIPEKVTSGGGDDIFDNDRDDIDNINNPVRVSIDVGLDNEIVDDIDHEVEVSKSPMSAGGDNENAKLLDIGSDNELVEGMNDIDAARTKTLLNVLCTDDGDSVADSIGDSVVDSELEREMLTPEDEAAQWPRGQGNPSHGGDDPEVDSIHDV